MAYPRNASHVLEQMFLLIYVWRNKRILIELQKEFHTLGHKIILQKLICLGFITLLIEWCEFNLSNKKAFVSVDDVFSEAGI